MYIDNSTDTLSLTPIHHIHPVKMLFEVDFSPCLITAISFFRGHCIPLSSDAMTVVGICSLKYVGSWKCQQTEAFFTWSSKITELLKSQNNWTFFCNCEQDFLGNYQLCCRCLFLDNVWERTAGAGLQKQTQSARVTQQVKQHLRRTWLDYVLSQDPSWDSSSVWRRIPTRNVIYPSFP